MFCVHNTQGKRLVISSYDIKTISIFCAKLLTSSVFSKNKTIFPRQETTPKLRDAIGLLKGLYLYFNHFITLKGEVKVFYL